MQACTCAARTVVVGDEDDGAAAGAAGAGDVALQAAVVVDDLAGLPTRLLRHVRRVVQARVVLLCRRRRRRGHLPSRAAGVLLGQGEPSGGHDDGEDDEEAAKQRHGEISVDRSVCVSGSGVQQPAYLFGDPPSAPDRRVRAVHLCAEASGLHARCSITKSHERSSRSDDNWGRVYIIKILVG